MRRKLPLPRGWNRHVRKSVLQILSLAWYTLTSVRGWAAQGRSFRTRLLTEIHFDVTTGIRFHPIEIALSMIIKMGVVSVLGAPAVGVPIFEVLLNGTVIFNHANVRVPRKLEPLVRWFVVTPDMHRVHHSVDVGERTSNFGFNLPWWDRMLGTYRVQPADGHEGMLIGLESFREATWQTLPRLLAMPAVREIPTCPMSCQATELQKSKTIEAL